MPMTRSGERGDSISRWVEEAMKVLEPGFTYAFLTSKVHCWYISRISAFKNGMCTTAVPFISKFKFLHFKSSWSLFLFSFSYVLSKWMHLYPMLIVPLIFNKLSYPFIIPNSFHFQCQDCQCNMRSVIAKHPSFLKWYVTKFLAIHNSSLTWVLLSQN